MCGCFGLYTNAFPVVLVRFDAQGTTNDRDTEYKYIYTNKYVQRRSGESALGLMRARQGTTNERHSTNNLSDMYKGERRCDCTWFDAQGSTKKKRRECTFGLLGHNGRVQFEFRVTVHRSEVRGRQGKTNGRDRQTGQIIYHSDIYKGEEV